MSEPSCCILLHLGGFVSGLQPQVSWATQAWEIVTEMQYPDAARTLARR